MFHPAESQWDLPKLVEQTASTFTSLSPNNVRLFFPRSGHSLCANERFLASSSPYFETLFVSGFSEDKTLATDPAVDGDAEEPPPYTFDDSDDETDGLLGNRSLDGKKESPALACKTITVTDTAYSTYFAVLVLLVTGKVTFASGRACRSLPPPRPITRSASPRSTAIASAIAAQTAPTPPPVSAKSVYRLAHLLELDTLASLALSEIRSQLGVENVAYALYSDVAATYPEVRSAVLDFAVEKWEKIVGAEATKEMEGLAEGGQADAAGAATAMKLARRLAARIKPRRQFLRHRLIAMTAPSTTTP
ncbi:BTB/POZ-like domain containing protein [Rhodotorula toruloides]|uniref:BTB/POZ-like domain containing protein n=1 Tax=Rhodotorula toruloides TaxID=5286 RepID=A0A511KGB1_RHOTO|nr:BTB/POZ-like domain containing protein [Rhodotorula toruloides]